MLARSLALSVLIIKRASLRSAQDLVVDDCMLLDCVTSVFLWVGSSANKDEKKEAISTAQKYVQTASDNRDPDCSIMLIKSGAEPTMFTQHFLGWDSEYFAKNAYSDPYEAKLNAMKGSQQAQGEAAASQAAEPEIEVISATGPAPGEVAAGTTYSVAELKAGGCAGVDSHLKENYLSADDFQATFKMDLAAFQAMPKWKQQTAKKSAGLF